MKKLIPHGRLVAGAVILVLLLILYFVVLFKLQIIEGAKYSEESANSIVSTETVAASRGNILDRYGRLLVSSRPCHNIVLNTDELFEQEDPNAVILQLINLVKECGDTYNDDLPITMEAPFEYVENMSFLFDCKCFFGTIVSVLKHDGVVEGGTGQMEKEKNQ